MHPIATLTFNPCIDKSTAIPALVPEKKLRCSEPHFEPGGGGINVARAIKKLGGDALAIYPAGGYSGKFFNILLENEGISSNCIETKSHTRENLIVLDQSKNVQYRFGMPGSKLQESEWKQCIDTFNNQESAFKVLSGSWSPELPAGIIREIAFSAKEKRQQLIVDTSGEPLQIALQAGVFMIKPNLGELGALLNVKATVGTAAALAKQIVLKGQAKVVVVSLGADGAILVTQNLSKHFIPPAVKRQSTVGAGDSMVAGITWKLSNDHHIEDAVKFGVACGTAATMNPGTELCRLEDANELFNSVETRTIDTDHSHDPG